MMEEDLLKGMEKNISDCPQELSVDNLIFDEIEDQQNNLLSDDGPVIRTITNYTFSNSSNYVTGISLQGRTHIKDKSPCQDYHFFEKIDTDWYLFVVSDGAGSAQSADKGSKANCQLIVELVHRLLNSNKWIENNYLPTDKEWYLESRAIFEKMKSFYEYKVRELGNGTIEKDYNATALFLIVSPKGMMCAHIGDGRMGYQTLDGEWKELMIPHKGDEANQTLFVQSDWSIPSVPALRISGISIPETRVIVDIPQTVILMSDGCEKATWECISLDEKTNRYLDRNKPFSGFLNPLQDALDKESENNRTDLLYNIIDHGTIACQREQDDKTMLIGRFIENLNDIFHHQELS